MPHSHAGLICRSRQLMVFSQDSQGWLKGVGAHSGSAELASLTGC